MPRVASKAMSYHYFYYSVMDALGFRELRLSTRGLRFAALMHLSPESPCRPSVQAP
jgi:hypothetical protein